MKWKGMDKLISAFKTKSKASDEAVKSLVKRYGAKLQQDEMRDVPVDTGFLKRSIMLSSEDSGKTAIVEPTANYAAYVEYGTRYMNAQPYIRPNYQKEAEAFVREVKKLER